MAKKKNWSYQAGERGRNRVRAFEDSKTGVIFLEYYEPVLGGEPKRQRVSTRHRDRSQAKAQAEELMVARGKREPPRTEDLTLRRLFDIYLGEVTPHKGSESKRSHDHRCAELFLQLFGNSRKPHSLNLRDWNRFINGRRDGSICPPGKKKGQAVGNRTVAYDLAWLRAVLNWAELAGDGKGGKLLASNPLKGLPLPREDNPQSHMLGIDRYMSMLEVADEVAQQFRLALILAYETGRRIGAIRQLRWSDVEWETGRIRWRADTDKIGKESFTPLSIEALEELTRVQRQYMAIGDAWLFPSPEDASKPCSRHLVRDWWYRAEKAAKLDHIPRTAWHGFRRTFATEMAREGVGLATIAALGGWTEPQTIVRHYLKTDDETMREALVRRKQREAVG
jgi:integrase